MASTTSTAASSLPRTTTLIAATVGTLVTGFVAYAFYFDHRRRSDPEFRRSLKREAKKTAKQAKEAEEAGAQEQKQAIRAAVSAANEEGYPRDSEDVEAYFMQEVAKGEGMCQDGKLSPFPLMVGIIAEEDS